MDDIQNQYGSNDKRQEVVQHDQTDILDYFKVIFTHRRMILLICGVAVVTTAVVSLSSPKVYLAAATIVPPIQVLQRESGIAERFGAQQNLILRQAIGVAGVAQIYVGILESRAVVDAIIDKFDLVTVYKAKGYISNAR
jgi:tyrosine-protein kinase Etk/Wzc